jgi:uncharacterized protein HemY
MFLIRFILFVVIVYLVLVILGRVILLSFKKRYFNVWNDHKRRNRRQEGDSYIQFDSKKKKKIGKDEGEYVNYEEINDK